MQLTDTLVRPLITEKTTTQLPEGTYAFQVGIKANKHQIAQAVEDYYGVEVDSVRTMIVRGKVKRFGRHMGKQPNWKKAYVKLSPGHSINLYETPATD